MIPPQVKIMKSWDPTGREGPRTPLPDVVKVHEPKEEELYGKHFIKDDM